MSGRGCKTVEFRTVHGGIVRARIYGGKEVLLDDVLAEVEPNVEKTIGFDQWLAMQPADQQRLIRLEIEDEARMKADEGRPTEQDDREYAAEKRMDEERDERLIGGAS